MQRVLRLAERRAGHRSRRIDDEDRFLRQAHTDRRLGRHQHQQRVGVWAALLRKHCRFRLVAEVGLPDELEVAIGWNITAGQRHVVTRAGDNGRCHLLIRAVDAPQRNAGIEIDSLAPSSPQQTRLVATIPNIFGPGVSADMSYYQTKAGAKVFAAGAFSLAASIWQPPVRRMAENLWARLASDEDTGGGGH